MNTKRNILEKLFNKLKELYSDSVQYKAFLKRLCEELKISYEDNEDLERLLKKILDKSCSSGCSELYDTVLNILEIEIGGLELKQAVDGLGKDLHKGLEEKKNNDQGLTL